jgi:hypothetical protein
MNAAVYLCCFLPLLIILIEYRTQTQTFVQQRIFNKRKEEKRLMFESIKVFLGEDCSVTTMNSLNGLLKGTITAVEDGWITVESKSGTEMVNLDYVVSIRRNSKKSKKASAEETL